MKRTVLNILVFVVILGLGCMGGAVPGNTGWLSSYCITDDGRYLDAGFLGRKFGCRIVNKEEFFLGLSRLSSQQVCQSAILEKPGAVPIWDPVDRFSYYVEEAKRRSFTPKSCGKIVDTQLPDTAAQPDFTAQLAPGWDAYNRGDYTTALEEWRPFAEQGVVAAQYNLGFMYEQGKGVSQDNWTAVKWYRLAAEQGHTLAPHYLKSLQQRIAEQNHPPTVTGAKKAKAEVVRHTSDLVVRQFPSNDANEIAYLPRNEEFIIQHNAGTGWAYIQFSIGRRGYVPSTGLPQVAGHLEKQFAEQQPAPRDTSEKTHTPPSGDFQKGLDAYQRRDYATALRELTPLADQGNALAQIMLGLMYGNGWGVSQNSKTALHYYKLAAEQGNSLAQHNLGWMYQRGDGVAQNYKVALKWYRLSVEQGNAHGQNSLGSMYASGWGLPKNLKTAAKWYALAAEQGFALAQVNLAKLYESERGVGQNYKTAAKWYTLAAEQGNASAQASLAWMYDQGDGVSQDYKIAAKWFRLAAKQGNARGQVNLGVMYQQGKGVPQDYKAAVKWYRLAAEKGLAFAQSNLGVMYENGWGVAQNYEIALKWYRLGADQNYAFAQLYLGQMYEKGYGVARNYSTALKWYGLSAEQGNFYAQTNLGAMYKNGLGVPRNYETSFGWYQLAAKKGHARAQVHLGQLYEKGQGVAQDNQSALSWYRRSAEQKDRLAQSNLENLLNKMAEQKPVTTVVAEKLKLNKLQKKASLIVEPSISFGDYHALVIGNNDYVHLPKLENAVQDAKDVSSVLERMYGFKVRTLLNASEDDIFTAMAEFRSILRKDSNFLIYYAGHGTIDKVTRAGYWQPVDAKEKVRSNWIHVAQVTNEIKAISAKHVLVIADSCYSGTLMRSSATGIDTAKDLEWYLRQAKRRSRTALASGRYDEQVQDGGGGKNSIFTKELLNALRNNPDIMDGSDLFDKLKKRVVLNSKQTPGYGPIQDAGDDEGHFILVRKDRQLGSPVVVDPLERAKKECSSELGRSKGTEKYGDCVMMLFQNFTALHK